MMSFFILYCGWGTGTCLGTEYLDLLVDILYYCVSLFREYWLVSELDEVALPSLSL